jgi:hypothetical protein
MTANLRGSDANALFVLLFVLHFISETVTLVTSMQQEPVRLISVVSFFISKFNTFQSSTECSEMSLQSQSKYHPDFDFLQGPSIPDIALSSSEGTLYRIPSVILHIASGFFRSLLSLGSSHDAENINSANTTSAGPIQIPTSQPDRILSIFLRMICALEVPALTSFDFDQVWEILLLCESWEAPGPISIIRAGIIAPKFLSQPLKLYRIANHFGWEDEAKLASTHSLKLNLFSEENQKDLSLLPGGALLKLIGLHRSRRDLFKTKLDDAQVFNMGSSTSGCSGCGSEIDRAQWKELKHRLFHEMDRNASGDEILSGLSEWPEADACWNASCPKCTKLLYTKSCTLRDLKSSLDALPSTI